MRSVAIIVQQRRDCLRFCFMHIIQEDLLHVALEWNTHGLRKNKAASSPPGHPDALFYMPQVYGTIIWPLSMQLSCIINFVSHSGAQNYLCPVSGSDLGSRAMLAVCRVTWSTRLIRISANVTTYYGSTQFVIYKKQ